MKTLLLFLTLAVAAVAATPPEREIEALLTYLGGLDGAVFIRNGSEHTAKEAADHVRMKWDRQKDKVHNAEEFIALCAAKSTMSGDRYEIRLKDGTKVFSDDFLRSELSRLRAAAAPSARP